MCCKHIFHNDTITTILYYNWYCDEQGRPANTQARRQLYVLPHQRLWTFDVLVWPRMSAKECFQLQPLVCGTVFHRTSLYDCPSLSIFCCRLKSHLFSLPYPAFLSLLLFWWLGGVVVRALDSRWAGREFDSHAAAALSGNNLGQVVHTNVPLFTEQYNLVPCEGLYA